VTVNRFQSIEQTPPIRALATDLRVLLGKHMVDGGIGDMVNVQSNVLMVGTHFLNSHLWLDIVGRDERQAN
jgi:hypothetical protein